MKPNWQEITEEAVAFAKSRSINPIEAVLCFEQCAKFMANYDKSNKEEGFKGLDKDLKEYVERHAYNPELNTLSLEEEEQRLKDKAIKKE